MSQWVRYGGVVVRVPADAKYLFYKASGLVLGPTGPLILLIQSSGSQPIFTWQPISINCTRHISSATRHNVQLISQLLTCILFYTVDVSAIIQFFFSLTPNPGSCPCRYLYPRLGIIVIEGEFSGGKATSA